MPLRCRLRRVAPANPHLMHSSLCVVALHAGAHGHLEATVENEGEIWGVSEHSYPLGWSTETSDATVCAADRHAHWHFHLKKAVVSLGPDNLP